MNQKQALDNCAELLSITINDIFSSPDTFTSYLNVCSNLPTLDYKNQLLAYAQKPESTELAGFKAWKIQGYNIQNNQSPILLLLPEFKLIDSDIETEEVKYDIDYNVVYVFDISQTNKPLDNNDPEIDYERIIRNITGYTLREAKEPELKKYEGYRLVYSDQEIIYYFSLDDNKRNEYLIKAYISYSMQDLNCKYADYAKLAVWYTVLNHFNFNPKDITFAPFMSLPDNHDIRTTLLQDIQYYTNKVIQDFTGYYLDFVETSIINQLMTNDNATELYMHFENVLKFTQDKSIIHAIHNLRDKMLKADKNYPQVLYKDRNACKIFSNPPYPFVMDSKNNKPLGGYGYDRERYLNCMLRN